MGLRSPGAEAKLSLCNSSCFPPSPGAAAKPEFISMQSALIWDAGERGNKQTNVKAEGWGCCGARRVRGSGGRQPFRVTFLIH